MYDPIWIGLENIPIALSCRLYTLPKFIKKEKTFNLLWISWTKWSKMNNKLYFHLVFLLGKKTTNLVLIIAHTTLKIKKSCEIPIKLALFALFSVNPRNLSFLRWFWQIKIYLKRKSHHRSFPKSEWREPMCFGLGWSTREPRVSGCFYFGQKYAKWTHFWKCAKIKASA